MAFDSESLGLHPGAVSLLRDLVHERLGLFYSDDRIDTLEDRLAPLVTDRGFGSFLDYFYFLKYDAQGALEWDRVMDTLSVQETYFWREIDQLRAIVSDVNPGLVRQHRYRPIRIWSVPCATGEEPLSIAMLLEEQRWFERADIELRAGDASPHALSRARQGLYRDRALRALPPPLRTRFFRKCKDSWLIDPALHARVSGWHQINLMNPLDVSAIGMADVLFCRNVFIYFSEAGTRRVVDNIADRMPTPGYLCVGAAESLLRVTDRFELEDIGGAFVYVKRSPLSDHLP
jgi:chemotaxis protein methyltransferase CheR